MKLWNRRLFAVLTISLLIGGCSQPEPDTKAAGAHLSEAEVIRIASAAAVKDGRSLTNYKAPEAHYQFTRKDGTWTVFYDGKVAMPGNHFLVTVDDRTGAARLRPGE